MKQLKYLINVALVVLIVFSCKTVNTLSNNDDLEKEVKSEEGVHTIYSQDEIYQKFIEMLNNAFEGDFRLTILEHDADSVVKAIHSYNKGDSILIKNGEKMLLENIKKD